MEHQLESFKQRIAAAVDAKAPLRLQGGATRSWYGRAPQGDMLDTAGYHGIIDYEPTELVISARCGTRLAELERALAAQGQMLAFEPPRFGAASTVGAMVACAMSGPRRPYAGALRDFVLGATLLDGRGEVLHFGGRVMKNVAGYDVARMLAGSMGTLGLIVDVTLKVAPLPREDVTLAFETDQEAALAQLLAWGRRPLPVSGSCWVGGKLFVRLSGFAAAVSAAAREFGGEPVTDGLAFWASVRDQQHAFFSGDAPLWRLSLPPGAPVIALPGAVMVEWGGAQRWVRTALGAGSLHHVASSAGGHATLFRGGDRETDVFAPLPRPIAAIHQRLKHAFDPAGIFNPGRMYKET